MASLIDTCVFVAAFISTHVHHELSYQFLKRSLTKPHDVLVATHGLAECYAALTAYPINPSISPELAKRLIQVNIADVYKIVDLSAKDYRDAINRVTANGLRSGAIYDALHLQAALKKMANKIITWNVKDFNRMITGEAIAVTTP